MNLKKIVVGFALVFACGSSAFAEKPFTVSIWEDITMPRSVNQQDNRMSSLLLEYYKSEIATHSKLKLAPNADVEKAISALRHRAGQPLTPDEVKTVLKETNAQYLGLLAVLRDGENTSVRVTLYDQSGEQQKPIEVPHNSIRESDHTAILLAVSTARAIRGQSPVDRLNMQREKQMLEEMKHDLEYPAKRYTKD